MSRPRIEVASLWVAAVAVVLAGWTGIVTQFGIEEINGGQAVFVTMCALAAPALASAMMSRHPGERTGLWVGLTVLLTMLAACRTIDLGPVAPIAGVTALLAAPLPAVVVAQYSTLLIPPRIARMARGCFWTAATIGAALSVTLFVSGSVPTTLWFTPSPGPPAGLATVLLVVHSAVTCAGPLMLAMPILRPMPRAARVAARPIIWPVTGWAFALTASQVWAVAGALGSPTRDLSEGLDATLFVVLPAFLVGALAAGIGWIDVRVRIATSEARMSVPSPLVDVEQYLSRALADPSVRVLYPVSGSAGWVDARGRRADREAGAVDRASTVIVRGPQVIGLIDQDAAATAHPDAVELVATSAGLMMETERLRASAARDLEETRLLAERLLVASDEPRKALRTTLVNGPLAELESIERALTAGTPLTEIAPRLAAVAADVRTISHGVLSASLETGGLRASLGRHLVPRHRYAPVIEMTTYLAVRADPSSRIEETMSENGPCLVIRTGAEPGLDVRDRVTALGGTVSSLESGWTIVVPTGAWPDQR